MNSKYVVALSFANYLKDKSGVPKVMMAHQQMYNEEQISYVALFSVKKNILNDRVMLFCEFGLIIDGEYLGIYQMSQIQHMLFQWNREGKVLLDIHLHHFMYVRVSSVDELLSAAPTVSIKVYLHDYYNACAGYNLMKNGDVFCGGNGFSEETCSGCNYYERAKRIQPQIHSLLKKHLDRVMFISPSEITKKFYLNFHPEYKDKVTVIPHQTYSTFYCGNLEPVRSDEKLRIAYLGMPAKHKGWLAWENLVENAPAQRYTFTVFNSSDEQYPNMEKIKLSFSKDNLNAMGSCLREYRVHVAVLWSLCPETYSYTCFEAYSANAFIITNSRSGNIADVVKKNKMGIVLKSEEELMKLFSEPDRLMEMINEYRSRSKGGPNELCENKQIVWLSKQYHKNTIVIHDSKKWVNYPLLWILNRVSRW